MPDLILKRLVVLLAICPIFAILGYLAHQKWVYQRDFDPMVWKAEVVRDGAPYVERWRMIESLRDRYDSESTTAEILNDLATPDKCVNSDKLDVSNGCLDWDLGSGGYDSLHVFVEDGRYAGMSTAKNW